jgi:hypothetical protein
MATRPAPSVEQIIDALSDKSNAHLMYLRGDRAVVWINAVHRVRHEFRTNTPKAEEWLLDIINVENSPLILIEVGPVVARLTGPTLRNLNPQLLDWPEDVHKNFKFTDRGQLVLMRNGTRPGSYQNYTRWLVLRDALPAMRDRVATDVAETDREYRNLKARDAAAFNEIHGSDLDVLRAFLDSANVALPDKDAWVEPDAVSTWMSGSRKHTELWGTQGSMTISLRGNQITAVADLLRKLSDQ